MHFNTLAKAALVGSLALEAAAGPVQMHDILDTREPAAKSHLAQHQQRSAGHAAHAPTYLKEDKLPTPPDRRFAVGRRAIPDTHTLHERQPQTWARRWNRSKRAPADATLPMRIGLKARNLDDGHKRLMDMSNPASSRFGKHMSAKEVTDLFAPERATVDAVVDWVTASGIHIDRVSLSSNKQWIQFDASVAEAEELLLTEFHIFEHSQTGTSDVAADHYHVPHSVQPHIDYITPGIRLRHDGGAKAKKQKRQDEQKAAAAELKRRGVKAMHTDPERLGKSAGGATGSTGATKGALAATTKPPAFNSSTCYLYVTPDCIRSQYGIPHGTTAAEGNQLGVFESLDQHYNKQDLDAYFAVMAPEIPQGTYPENRLIDGAEADTTVALAGSEAELDFQAVMPLIYPQASVLYQVDDERIQFNETQGQTPYVGFWNTFFDAIDGSYCTYSAFGETGNCVKPECLDPSYPDVTPPGGGGYNGTLQCGVYEPTNVISISYGGGEADLPAYYWKRQCSEIMKLGLQGVTVVISSGDYGVASFEYDGGNYDGCAGDDGQIFFPASQATCPYVLAVGSTEFDATTVTPSNKTSNCSVPSTTTKTPQPRITERATTRFGSGGGFSNYFDQPDYQADAVANYFDSVSLSFSGYADRGDANFSDVGNGVFHTGGRGYPDVSAVGDHFLTVLNGEWATIGGTSLAAPLWASVLTLVNEARLAQGKKTVGFVNPTLYQHPEVFNDITAGSNPGCNTDGFPAAKGWDPVTGLGTPVFPKLLELFKSLP